MPVTVINTRIFTCEQKVAHLLSSKVINFVTNSPQSLFSLWYLSLLVRIIDMFLSKFRINTFRNLYKVV